ncbi:MAG: GtrA family protein [Sporolactobacillus sp.]
MNDKQQQYAARQRLDDLRAHWIGQMISFGLVGVLNTAVDFLTFLLLTQVFSLYFAVAQVISYTAGTLNSYLFNSKITFSKSEKSRTRLTKFIALNIFVLLFTLLIMHSLLFLPLIVDKLIVTAAGLAVNFLLSKFWVFKR